MHVLVHRCLIQHVWYTEHVQNVKKGFYTLISVIVPIFYLLSITTTVCKNCYCSYSRYVRVIWQTYIFKAKTCILLEFQNFLKSFQGQMKDRFNYGKSEPY